MIAKFGILVIAAYVYSAGAAPPPCTCARNYEPVCGADGVTYGNDCLRACAGVQPQRPGECNPQPSCICTDQYQPVCGSDGVTYGNACELNCATAQNPKLSVAQEGECAVPPQPDCICTAEYKPVCGSDGKTYGNLCNLNCATVQNSRLSVEYEGECKAPSEPDCICTRQYKPVCGSDGKTYGNACNLNCATAQNPTLRLEYEGECSPLQPDCICPRGGFSPLCASDGKTYSNECQFNCAKGQNPELTVVHEGHCDTPLPPTCICPLIYSPVCGSDGTTYSNGCLLNCAKAQDSQLSVAYSGDCRVPTQPDCICTQQYQPVCGTDGKTYGNACNLNCATAQNSRLSVAYEGECKAPPQSDCICTAQYLPVCGTDGNTYGNACNLNCAAAQKPGLSVAYEGECEEDCPSDVNIVEVAPDANRIKRSDNECTCGRELIPVCGSDGKTYGNDCLLNCAAAKNPSITLARAGSCESSVNVVDPSPDAACTCGRDMKQVCGSDGKTYNNECLLNCAAAKDPSLTLARGGPCASAVNVVDPSPDNECTCGRELIPVCGSNGKTYGNDCLLNCAAAKDPSLTLAREGSCESSVNVVDPSPDTACTCGRDMKQVCGSDGKTYNNECLLNCAATKNPSLTLARGGPCATPVNVSPIKVVDPSPDNECTCGRELIPVCGSDGKTYGNECLFNCAAAKDPSLILARQGSCASPVNVSPIKVVDPSPDNECTCGRELIPVCGSDGKTYGNDCLFNCAAAKDPSLSLARQGSCESPKNVTPIKVADPSPDTPCTCGKNLKPVCGSDGKTYNNECLLNCAAAKNPSLTVSRGGRCLSSVRVPNSCICPQIYSPVYDENGTMYPNQCALNCAKRNQGQ